MFRRYKSFKTTGTIYSTTKRNIPEDLHFQEAAHLNATVNMITQEHQHVVQLDIACMTGTSGGARCVQVDALNLMLGEHEGR
jgi:hypothetical protein